MTFYANKSSYFPFELLSGVTIYYNILLRRTISKKKEENSLFICKRIRVLFAITCSEYLYIRIHVLNPLNFNSNAFTII